MHLTTSHRFHGKGEAPTPEMERVAAAGCKIGRAMDPRTQAPGGPLRAWPGGLAMGRALGDSDCGSWLIPTPSVCSVELPDDGVDIVIASDGLWDALSLREVYELVERWPSMER